MTVHSKSPAIAPAMTSPEATPPPPALGRGLVFAMAAAAGLAVANIYYSQPMLGQMERALPGGLATLIPTATQLGYAAGLFLLVPLGDLIERRRLIVVQFLAVAVALAASALAPGAVVALLAALMLGAAASVAQQIVPLAAHLAAPERRGAIVGMVMSGLLTGILLSRALAGFVAAHAGWREMFWLGVPLALGSAALMAWRLPHSRPQGGMGYGRLMGSLAGLWREFPELRRATLTQALIFGAFMAFWTILALRLEQPPFALGSEVAGLFGIVGAVGILAAPLAGRIADSKGPHRMIVLGAALCLAGWAVLAAWVSVAGMVVGVIVLDFAMQSALISHQHIIYALRPEARSRINTLFMGGMFLGGAGGSGTATLAWSVGGWGGVAALGLGLGALATLLQAARRKA